MKVILAVLFVFCSVPSEARLLQIIHTNDLHSFFSQHANNSGGYSRVMTKIKEIREASIANGVEVLQLDAGDWGDGTSFYLSDDGADSIRALALLGTEFSIIGNHDHMLGGKVLGNQIRKANVATKFLTANISTTPEMKLEGVVAPYADLEKAGIKIRVIGLTTSDNYFEYSFRPGAIKSPVPVGEKEGKAAKTAGRELVIALTHLGLSEDKVLAQNSTSIDLIVGGHSHSKLSKITWQNNKNNKSVPIVQAWAQGLGVGSLLLDVSNSGEVKVVDYKLHEITSSIASDPQMDALIEASIEKRNKLFSMNWDEVIGQTETEIRGYKNGLPGWGRSCWGKHIARAIRKATGASVGINVSGFLGVGKAAGPVRFGDIVDNLPHIKKYGDEGWEIATIIMSGAKLRPLMWWASRRGYSIDFSGLGYKASPIDSVNTKATYRVAIPAEIARAIQGSNQDYQQYLRGLKYTGKFYWPVVTDYVKKNSPIKCE